MENGTSIMFRPLPAALNGALKKPALVSALPISVQGLLYDKLTKKPMELADSSNRKSRLFYLTQASVGKPLKGTISREDALRIAQSGIIRLQKAGTAVFANEIWTATQLGDAGKRFQIAARVLEKSDPALAEALNAMGKESMDTSLRIIDLKVFTEKFNRENPVRS